jgi:hypothetical protein
MKPETRRSFLSSALGLWLGVRTAWGEPKLAHAAAARVYVFVTTSVRPHVLQRMLEDEMPNVAVSVFGRVGDFTNALEEAPPDAALAIAPVLFALGYQPLLQGSWGGSTVEQYLVLSEAELRPEALSELTLGCVDVVGRKKLPEFVAAVLGLPRPPEVQRVTKVEDLLKLLQFKRADALLLPERHLAEIREVTKMSVKIMRPLGAKVLRTAIAFPGQQPGGRHPVEAALRGLSKNVLQHLGVDAWS